MKKLSLGLALIMSAMVVFAGCAPTTPSKTEESSSVTAEGSQSLAKAKEAYLQKVDVEYSYNLANTIQTAVQVLVCNSCTI